MADKVISGMKTLNSNAGVVPLSRLLDRRLFRWVLRWALPLLVAGGWAVSAGAQAVSSNVPVDVVNLQLRWKHQFQFAGYYAALEKGYYRDAGLDVRIHEGAPGKAPVDEVIAGRADQIAPVDRVMAFYTAVGAKGRRLGVAGRATGFAVDYGHLDLTLGDHAATEIFPLIAEWLRR